MNEIRLETVEGTIVSGKLITLAELNKIGRNPHNSLTYFMNVMDGAHNSNDIYMWFNDSATDIDYLVKIK